MREYYALAVLSDLIGRHYHPNPKSGCKQGHAFAVRCRNAIKAGRLPAQKFGLSVGRCAWGATADSFGRWAGILLEDMASVEPKANRAIILMQANEPHRYRTSQGIIDKETGHGD